MIQKRLEELNKKWKTKRDYKSFTNDGVLNYQTWEFQNPKVLFLLKESADGFIEIVGKEHDIRKGNGPHFWWNICYWKYLITNIYLKKNIDFISKLELPEVVCNNYLLDSIAYVNIKKNNEGLTKSNRGDILKYAKQDQDLLKEQIDIICPNVIFCSSDTFEAYRHIYGPNLLKLNDTCFRHNDRLIIKFYHPSYGFLTGGRKAIYYKLKNSIISDIDLPTQFNW